LAPPGKAGGLSWSPAENLHITTKFIGEWQEARLNELINVLHALPHLGEIEIVIRGVGWFPDEDQPRVFWAGVECDGRLTTLAHSTEHAVASLGIPVEERNYSPHLTLARIRERVPLESLRKTLASSLTDFAAYDFGRFRASRFALYISAAGQYTALETFAL
jgi:2'-5' RNA ligase